jgi:hypothetical protein
MPPSRQGGPWERHGLELGEGALYPQSSERAPSTLSLGAAALAPLFWHWAPLRPTCLPNEAKGL